MTVSNYSTIPELKQAERYSEAGYGCLFAYNKVNYNAMIDARMKSKFMRKLDPITYAETQDELVYAGPTVFYDEKKEIEYHKIDKMDIKSAYLSYLVNEKIRKPGMIRIKETMYHKHDEKIRLYVLRFNCENTNLFVKWFLNSSAIHKKKFKSDGSRISGTISIFSSTWMNNLKYIHNFLTIDEVEIEKSYLFIGKQTVPVNKEQIYKLYQEKEWGSKAAKKMLVQSTGWLSIIDKPTYYHMLQYIKYFLLETVYNYGLEHDIVGVQTDCLFIRVNTRTQGKAQQIMNDRMSVANKKLSTIGRFTHQRVNYDEIITKTARVVLK